MSGPSSIKQDESTTPIKFADVPWSFRLVHGVRRSLARWLAAQSLHERQATTCGLQIKRRLPRARILIPLGNLYLRLQGATSEILSTQLWIEWESAIGSLSGRGIRACDDRAGLKLPMIAGVSLEEVLRSHRSLQSKLQSISRAAEGLRTFHCWLITSSGVSEWPLSHGDATCRNVMIDESAGRATWIDFDMRHRVSLPQLFRQADDLRTLIGSCACWLDRSNYPALVDVVCEGYAVADVIDEMQRLVRDWRYPNVFQLAQAPLQIDKFLQLRALISHRPVTMSYPKAREPARLID